MSNADLHNTQNHRLGVIGLGVMGSRMAKNILKRSTPGTPLAISAVDKTNTEPLIDAGATWYDHAKGIAEAADIVLVMVPDLPDVKNVLAGSQGLLAGWQHPNLELADLDGDPQETPIADNKPEKLVIVASTVSPTKVAALGRQLAKITNNQVQLIDAAVSGGQDGAEDGTLAIMVGGNQTQFELAQPLLSCCGNPVLLGPVGSGQVVKACNQIIVAAAVTALGEAAVLAERSGIDLQKMFDLLQDGYAGSRILDVKKQRYVEHDHSPSGPAKFMIKDLGFAQEVGEHTGTPTPQTDILRQLFTELTEAGWGDNDTAVIQRFIEDQKRH